MEYEKIAVFECMYCCKKYKKKKVLYEHIREVHKVPVVAEGNLKCPINACNFSCRTFEELRNHARDQHGYTLNSVEMTFNTYEGKILEICIFCDKRFSGFYNSKSKGVRAIKSQGTCKIEGHCPSTIEVTSNGIIKILYFQTHVGHTVDLEHLPLTKDLREVIAGKFLYELDCEIQYKTDIIIQHYHINAIFSGKLNEGIPPQKILDSTRNSIKEDIYREHLLTKKDIHNISNSYCIGNDEQYHPTDAVSLRIWIEKMKCLDDNPVLFVKFQGEAADQHLEISDFCIIIMTNVQKHMLLKFGSDSICIDSTHGTNAYDFQLSTVLVIDEFNSGFPAAFCLSNRVNLGSMQKFFQCIRDKVGLLSVNCFMSDDAPVYYTAWTSVMCDAKFRILCTWHVKKAWLQAANSIIPSKRKEVLKFLNVVSECHDIKEFEALISDFLSKLFADRDTDKFANYFASNYANRCELWAKCYRKRCNITTNNHLEALHRVLKYSSYLDGLKNKRVDRCIAKLINMARCK
ncbi:uncharacterized protein LOC118180399 [Stegodyphus dumicola]|uniref:uncharacterized protein LOC118180399 n=1 Tax=Stegodyphus dumicola TaxID=202533 RepID=UPI0015AE3B88|nr:uncharacterized protein LOC118180399 [Stegodyphus dumicola]